MPRPGGLLRSLTRLSKYLERVAAYLDDVIVFDPDPAFHVDIRALYEGVLQQNLKLSPAKAKLGATDADVLRRTISSFGANTNADKVAAFAKCRCRKMSNNSAP